MHGKTGSASLGLLLSPRYSVASELAKSQWLPNVSQGQAFKVTLV